MTHSLSKPVLPSEQGPDPADVALFPIGGPGVGPDHPEFNRPRRSHRRPPRRGRAALLAGASMAAVVGSTALAATLIGSGTRPDDARLDEVNRPTMALPDGSRALEPAPVDSEKPEKSEGSGSASPDGEATSPPSGPPPGSTEPADPAETETDASGGPASPETPSPPPERSGNPPPPRTAPPPETPDPDPDPGGPDEGEDAAPRVLREGDEGPDVAELQYRLRQPWGIYDGGITGHYDRKTRQAVAKFQRWYGVQGELHGVYGFLTRDRLEEHTAALTGR
ncbi:peptidoglycan-binding domain-containing protein [Streptomyces sp. ACA25]|uniref:peptidoglycan-binding domain-containing protein n=1 Tax=Streptomyces sp. ACA25 TaxID=3022596 RepID=UPI002308153C|nr:peptidoglycan-binding domain-containing protein [Streptomyces sp. ACA25]MDB1087774.1 peptidoglycan-binding domain-containing protein [Streptomyces sp. ACA25]